MREIVVPYRIRMRFAQQGDYRCILTPPHAPSAGPRPGIT